MSVTTHAFQRLALRHCVSRDFLTPAIFQENVSSHTMKVPGGIANVGFLKLRQPLYHPIDRLVRIVFRIAQPLRHKDAYQARANYLVSFCCFFAIRIEPVKQSIKWIRGDGHLSTISSCTCGSIKTCAAKLKACLKLAQTHGNSKTVHLDIQFCGCCNPSSHHIMSKGSCLEVLA